MTFFFYNVTNLINGIGLLIYTVSQKKGATLTMAITLSILDGFVKFFRCCKEQ